jgi:hypothetical protein
MAKNKTTTGFAIAPSMESKIADIMGKAQALREAAKPEKIEVAQIEDAKPTKTLPVGYIGLSGIRVKDNGVITKDDFLQKLAPDESRYSDIVLTEEEVEKVKKTMRGMTAGVNSVVPLQCSGNECAFKATCPYMQIRKAPVGRACLVESQLIEYWTDQYLTEFDVDPSKLTEMHLVSELAELNIYEMRITKYIAETHQTLLQEVITGVDATGNVLSNLDVAKSFDLKERIKKQRMKVLEALMATRRERVKAVVAVSGSTDAAHKIADLKSRLDIIATQIAKTKVIDGVAEEV